MWSTIKFVSRTRNDGYLNIYEILQHLSLYCIYSAAWPRILNQHMYEYLGQVPYSNTRHDRSAGHSWLELRGILGSSSETTKMSYQMHCSRSHHLLLRFTASARTRPSTAAGVICCHGWVRAAATIFLWCNKTNCWWTPPLWAGHFGILFQAS